jgi:hypothetical protein
MRRRACIFERTGDSDGALEAADFEGTAKRRWSFFTTMPKAGCVTISKELAFLAACDLASDEFLGERCGLLARSGINWQRFQNLVVCHNMGTIVGARLPAAVLPAHVAACLRDLQRQGMISHLTHTAEAVRLVRYLADNGVQSIVLKGVAIAQMLYTPNPDWRVSSDIDLLVSEEEFAATAGLLVKAGYCRRSPKEELRGGQDMLLYLVNAFNFEHSSGVSLELHGRLTSNPYWLPLSFSATLASTRQIMIDREYIRGLEGGLLLAYLCWHALGHAGYRLKWFGDIARLLRGLSETERARALEICSQLGAERPVRLACAVASKLYSWIDEANTLGSDARWARDVRRIIANLEAAEPMPTRRRLGSVRQELHYVAFAMRLAQDHRAKAYQILRLLSDPRDVALLKLGRRWRYLYALVGPFLAAARFLVDPVRHATGIKH